MEGNSCQASHLIQGASSEALYFVNGIMKSPFCERCCVALNSMKSTSCENLLCVKVVIFVALNFVEGEIYEALYL